MKKKKKKKKYHISKKKKENDVNDIDVMDAILSSR